MLFRNGRKVTVFKNNVETARICQSAFIMFVSKRKTDGTCSQFGEIFINQIGGELRQSHQILKSKLLLDG